ncbi:MAG: glutathione synthase [Tistrella sp.]|uniref:glutathione synthase n=1 Tax=Tistrella sp. TaxID=2024861 RepID=UPI000C35C965|nr:glutathione synthase [Tistrella sp.]MAD39054.1 glutathione synthase [Tistrella sp.]MBA74715.1 glutathione synthase [Tistrella sp.]
MALTVALQMDPIETINFDGDTTFMLGLEALRRGHNLYHYQPSDLSLTPEGAVAWMRPLGLQRVRDDHYRLGPKERVPLREMDVVLLRQDPPFDMAYITSTHLLEHAGRRTLVSNDPVQVRNAPEKLFITRFPDLMPPSLVSSSVDEIRAFREEHGDIVIKPLYGFGGLGVFRVRPDDENLGALLELHALRGREPLVIQKYLPAVREGDKRIILVEGEPRGAVLRVPQRGEARANMHVGGRPVKTTLTARDREVCEAVGPELRARGLTLVGIDMIGDHLTEINVTCPTGIQEIDRLDGVTLERDVWDAIETRLTTLRAGAA